MCCVIDVHKFTCVTVQEHCNHMCCVIRYANIYTLDSRFDTSMCCTVNLEILFPINFFDGFILSWWFWTNSALLSYRQLWATLAICINPRWRSSSISSDIKVVVTEKLSNRIWFAIARFHRIMTGLATKFETSEYFVPIWLPKFKMAEKVQNITKNCYSSKTIEQNLICNSLLERYYVWTENKLRKKFLLGDKMVAKIQYGRKDWIELNWYFIAV